MRLQDGRPVLLDATMLGAEKLAERFPTIDALVRATGVDWAREPVPVTPAAHYAMGGVLTDMNGRTTVPGLFAVGEIGATGVHGANRLASNSLLEAVVVGWRAGDLVGAAGSVPALPVPAMHDAASVSISTIQESVSVEQLDTPVPIVRELAADALMNGAVSWTADRIRDRAWQALGLERTGDEMAEFARELMDARPADDEARSLLPLARLTAAAALARTESRGAHWRDDFPHTDPAQRARRVVVRPASESPELWRSDARAEVSA
jgi:L-aspartate oxidase